MYAELMQLRNKLTLCCSKNHESAFQGLAMERGTENRKRDWGFKIGKGRGDLKLGTCRQAYFFKNWINGSLSL